MTLLELCEPLFLYVCRLNRSARKGGSHEYHRVRGEVDAIFDQMQSKVKSEPRLIGQHERISKILVFFVDSMVSESALSFAREWDRNRKANELGELAGDERFWEILDETLGDSSPDATERLSVFYTCIGLGFTGLYTGQQEYLRNKMLQLSARLRGTVDTDVEKRICSEAYEHVDTSDLIEPAGTKLLGIGVALVGLAIVLFVANIFLFKRTSEELIDALDQVVAHERTVSGSQAPQAESPEGSGEGS